MKRTCKHPEMLYHFGRVLVASVFIYFGIEGLTNPEMWSGLIPDFITSVLPATTVVTIHATLELILGTLIVFNLGGVITIGLLGLSFIGVLTTVSGPTLARDVAIMGGLILLSFLSLTHHKNFSDQA